MEQLIQELAYQKWQSVGCPSNEEIRFWLEAKQEILKNESTANRWNIKELKY
jgi:hypothetical protein